MSICSICKQPMAADDDCGGDCTRCMADAGDPDCIAIMYERLKRQQPREELFDTLTHGMTSRRIAKAMDELTPGINWYGSTKASMRGAFCRAPAYCPYLDKVSAEEFEAALDKHRGVIPRNSVVPTPPPMKIFYNNQFHGHYPVGASALVVADSAEIAAKMLEAELTPLGLAQKIQTNDMVEIHMQVIILQDGNY